jgi:hypothetical protein
LLIWPVVEPAPPRLLTAMDAYGRIFNDEDDPEAPPLDALDLAAATAVRRLAGLVNQSNPPDLSGELTVAHAETTAAATPRRVWNQVSEPWLWLGNQGGADPARFEFHLYREPRLEARGSFTIEEPPTHLAFTWSWTTNRWEEAEIQEPYATEHDLITGESRTLTSTVKGRRAVPSWTLPPEPSIVHITLRRHGKGTTAVELDHRDLPVELAGTVQPFWEWALRELRSRLAKAPFYGYPWDR